MDATGRFFAPARAAVAAFGAAKYADVDSGDKTAVGNAVDASPCARQARNANAPAAFEILDAIPRDSPGRYPRPRENRVSGVGKRHVHMRIPRKRFRVAARDSQHCERHQRRASHVTPVTKEAYARGAPERSFRSWAIDSI